MKKILFITDGLKINQAALDFTCYLASLTNSTVTGIFLENVLGNAKPALEKVTGNLFQGSEERAYETKKEIIEKNNRSFTETCKRKSVRCNIHKDLGIPIGEVIIESRYADLAVISPDLSFSVKYEATPSGFVKMLLEGAECPVVIAPETFREIEEIVFTYNGSGSSVFATKQFTYLFPKLDDKKVTILRVNEKTWTDKEKNHFKAWLQNHYNAIGFEVLEGDPETKLFNWIQKRKNAFVIMGAYGRSRVSQYFRRSTAELLIRTLPHPIFITHL